MTEELLHALCVHDELNLVLYTRLLLPGLFLFDAISAMLVYPPTPPKMQKVIFGPLLSELLELYAICVSPNAMQMQTSMLTLRRSTGSSRQC